jgi:hypothetical protein
MAQLHVLLSEQGQVLGTLRHAGANGNGGPTSVGFRTAAGERVIEVSVDDATLALSPEELHKHLEAKHVAA